MCYESRAIMILIDLVANKKKPDSTDKPNALRSKDMQKKIELRPDSPQFGFSQVVITLNSGSQLFTNQMNS